MSFNYALAKEIYSLNPWLVDSHTLPGMTAILRNSKKGLSLELPENKYNSTQYLKILSGGEYELEVENTDLGFFETIGIINLDGPITVGGGASSFGMSELSAKMIQMAKNEKVKGFMIYVNSGGGSSAAVEIMTDTITEIQTEYNKPVYALVKKGGIACSAAYGIISPCNKIYSESEMNFVGSIGTMLQTEGVAANSVDGDGNKRIRLYATKSTKKNIEIEEALNNDNYELIINNILDPINERFIKKVGGYRPQLVGSSFDDGHDAFAKDVIGTFVDGIASFDDVVQMVLKDSNSNFSVNNNNNNSSLINSQKKMTKDDLKQNHPELYNSVVLEGVTNERERVKSYMTYAHVDLKSVQEGINSGGEITPSQREQFMLKLNSSNMLTNLNADSAKPLNVDETATTAVEQTGEDVNSELDKAFDFNL